MSADSSSSLAAGDADGPLGAELGRWGRLFGGFAHEIKNPLSTIGLHLRLLEEDVGEPSTPRDKRILTRTQRLSKEVMRLQGILQEFLDFVRAPEAQFAPVSLNLIVREISDLLRPEMERQDIRLNLLLTEGLEPATVDKNLVHQALLNLMRNAQEAIVGTGRSGEIIVGTAFDESTDSFVLSVTDSGPGMAEEVRQRCFEPYFSTKPGGTGLGLAITRRFVEDHGGNMRIDSHEGIGTKFELRVPRLPSRLAEPEA
ncbi:MAG: ATP-binding protein [Planctomycetota bacterium]|jgi:signal transduction histidine kinase|nr:ATP-binding protein [Planctomycetota bacterium]